MRTKLLLVGRGKICYLDIFEFVILFSDGGAGQRNERRRYWGACKKSKVISHFDPFSLCRYVLQFTIISTLSNRIISKIKKLSIHAYEF